MKFSKRLSSMQESPIRKLAPFATAAKAEGVEVYHLKYRPTRHYYTSRIL